VVTATVVDDHGARTNTTATVTMTAAGVRIWRPVMGGSSLQNVHVAATAYVPSDRTVATMQVLVDGQTALSTAASAPLLDTWMTMSLGTHTVVVNAIDDQGNVYHDMTIMTVKPEAGLTVGSPAQNDTVTGAVHFVADAVAPIGAGLTGMRIYVDGVDAYDVHVGKIDTVMPLESGSHTVVIKAWDSRGTVYQWSSSIAVK
jgi:hypothetical protein